MTYNPNPKSPQWREARMNNEAGCTFPKCECTVPDYAFSMHNRVNYCDKLAVLEKADEQQGTEIPGTKEAT